jgi:hypothetical protein
MRLGPGYRRRKEKEQPTKRSASARRTFTYLDGLAFRAERVPSARGAFLPIVARPLPVWRGKLRSAG